jgi:hypothetical protein
MEAVLVYSRRVAAGAQDPVVGGLVLGSFVMWPVLVALFAVWLITGRGPAMRILTWQAGAPRQRLHR